MTDVTTMTLTEFLEAHFAEDEAEQIDYDRNGPRGWHDARCDLVGSEGTRACDCGIPARVLAECAAKRRIIDATRAGFPDEDRYSMGWHDARLWVLRFLVQPYADRPDFDQAWRL